jgi:hypothetical protein
VALQLQFFMSPEDEEELFRKLEQKQLDLWPEVGDRDGKPRLVDADAARSLDGPGYYFAVAPPTGFPIKRGQQRGLWKINEIESAVVYFCRSFLDEKGELRSGYFWVEMEPSGDWSRRGGKPDALRRLWLELQHHLKVRFRKSRPSGFFVGPHAARRFEAGTPLREAGRKGGLVEPFR